jgi:hypothetical protein
MKKTMETKLPSMSIDSDFPGGNIVVDRVDQDTVYLHQDLRDTEVFWFYWCFRVRNVGSRTLTFIFTLGDVIGTRGPAISHDAGLTWQWLGRSVVSTYSQGVGFRYTFSDKCEEVRFCFAFPYLESHLKTFTTAHTDNPAMHVDILCHTRKGRAVEVLTIGCLDECAVYRVLLTSRHHACESIASYVLEGMMAGILADTQTGRWLRNSVEFFIVPFMDKDGVEDGDQGKLRVPRDHNRDYQGESLYATTRALRHIIPQWSEGKLRAAIDLHCPYIKGEGHEVIYFVGGPDQKNWLRVLTLSKILEEIQTGSLKYQAADNLPYGQSWNTSDNTAEGRSFGHWAAELPGIVVGTSIEIPYANVRTQTVTADSARAFGHDLLQALCRFLREMS